MNALRIAILACALVLVIAVPALAIATPGVGNMHQECVDNGFDFGIAKYEWENGEYVLEEALDGYSTSVDGDASSIDWTSDPAADGILTKEALSTYVHDGGTSGSIDKTDKYDISHVTFCGYGEPVPEFGALAATGVLLAGIGLLLYRRR